MDESSFIQWMIGQAGVTGVAALSIWVMKVMNEQAIIRRSEDSKREQDRHDEAIRRERENAEIHREDKRHLLEVVRANTASNSRLIETINHLDARVEKS